MTEKIYRIWDYRKGRFVSDEERSLHLCSDFFVTQEGNVAEVITSISDGDVTLDLDQEYLDLSEIGVGGSVKMSPKFCVQKNTFKKDCEENYIFEGDKVRFWYKLDCHGDVFEDEGFVIFDKVDSTYSITLKEEDDEGDWWLNEVNKIKIIGNVLNK
jgi:hypothetical protein